MPTAPFIGRAAQLAEIEAAWAARRPGVVLITGEGGSGKSRLVAEVLHRLDLDGTTVLRGSARPQGAAPYDWLASVLNGRPAATLPVEESLLNRLAQRSLDAAEPRLAPATTLRAAVDVVRALLRGTATADNSALGIVVVEDLHDLDPASLALVAELAAAAETLPALMLVTSRPPQEAAFAPAAARTLRRLGGSPSVLRVHVAPFTVRETADLIEATYGSAPAPEAVRGARRRTGGNPFWLAELLAAYDTAGDLPAAPLPPHVAGLLVEPLSSEPELVGRVARAAALLGDPVESDVLFHVCGSDVEPALRRLLDLGLLLIAPDLAPTGSLRFRHPLLREALAAGVLPRERTRVHSLARGLAVELGDNAALARHAAALGRTAEARTAAARGAAASLATGLPEAAVELVALGLSLPARAADQDGRVTDHNGHAQNAQFSARDSQLDGQRSEDSTHPDEHSLHSRAQLTARDTQPDAQWPEDRAHLDAQRSEDSAHTDAQSTVHDAQSAVQSTARDGQSDAQSTAHDRQATARYGQSEAQSTAHDGPVTPRGGQSDAQCTAHDGPVTPRGGQSDAQCTAHDGPVTPRGGQSDAQSTAHDGPVSARDGRSDARSVARGEQSATPDRDDVRVALAGVGAAAAFVSARFEVAANYAGDWLHEVQQTDDRDGTADAHRQLAAVRWCLGDPDGHRRSLDRAAAVGGSAASLARQRAAEAESALRTEDAASALPLAESAVAAAERAGVGIASASVTLGTALALTGDFERGVALLRAARQLAGREHDPVTIGRAVHNLVAVSLPRLGEVMGWRLFDEAMGTIARYGLEFCAGRTTTLGVAHAMRTGDLARAEALVWSRLPIEGDPVERVRFMARAGLLALERGDDTLAVRMLARADAEGRDSGLVRVLRVAVAARGVHPVDPAEALRDCVGRCGPARLAEAARWALHGGVPATVVEEHVLDRPVRLRFLLAVAAGRDADAIDLLPAALGVGTLSDEAVRDRAPAAGAGGLGPGGFSAGGTGIIGLISGSGDARGRGAAAGSGSRRSARRAAAAAVADGVGPDDEVGDGVEAGGAALRRGDGDGRAEDAAVHTAAAHALVRLGRAGEARRHAERAVALLGHWPGWRLAEAETLLHSLRAGGDLTARELEVLGCLAAGMTNQQVASSLGISIRTVAVHVSNLLRKTGATSRTEAALWAVRHRLAPER